MFCQPVHVAVATALRLADAANPTALRIGRRPSAVLGCSLAKTAAAATIVGILKHRMLR